MLNQNLHTMKAINFEEITLRQRLSSRGGGIEIDLGKIYKKYKGQKMTAYQNYLGGGMLGGIANDCTIEDWSNDKKLVQIAEQLRRYMHSLTNPEDQEWESMTFEQNQNLPVSAY